MGYGRPDGWTNGPTDPHRDARTHLKTRAICAWAQSLPALQRRERAAKFHIDREQKNSVDNRRIDRDNNIKKEKADSKMYRRARMESLIIVMFDLSDDVSSVTSTISL